MYCPLCKMQFDHQYEISHGVHVNYPCPCGQLLQWDYHLTALRDYAFSIGPPQPCKHTDLMKLGALVPLLAL